MALNPGDIMFVGFDADNEDIAFVTTTNLQAGEVIYFTDDEWNGTAFNGSEQLFEWTVPAGGVAAGSIVNIDMFGGPAGATIDAGGVVDYINGGGQLSGTNEMFWAFQGTRVGDDVTPTNFIGVIGNEADGSSNQTPNLSGTGLTTSNGAIIIDGDEDFMEWSGEGTLPNPATQQEIIDSVSDLSNWITADGTGNNNPNGTGFTLVDMNVVCFAEGTRISVTNLESVPVEDLKIGMKVMTRDHGLQKIRWIGSRQISQEELEQNPKLYPIRIQASALGNNIPKHTLRVSRQHRMLLSSRIINKRIGKSDALVAAEKLKDFPGISVDQKCNSVEYFHIAFDDHEIIYAEDAPAESFFLGAEALKTLNEAQRDELYAIFPDLEPLDVTSDLAYPLLKGKLLKDVVYRHLKNRRPLLEMN